MAPARFSRSVFMMKLGVARFAAENFRLEMWLLILAASFSGKKWHLLGLAGGFS
jgi:hypothetical protein